MRQKLIALAVGTLIGGAMGDGSAATAPDTASANPNAPLIARVKLWMARDRDDLARQALDKLFRVAPDDPDGLALLAGLQARANDRKSSRATLQRLRSVAPNHPALANTEAQLRVQEKNGDLIRRAKQLAKFGKYDPAVAAELRGLFPDGQPSGDLGLYYWEIVASAPNQWEAARAGFARLVRDNRDNLHYRLALAEHIAKRTPDNREALRTMAELSKNPVVGRQALDAWRRTVLRLDPVEASVPLLEEYLKQDPGGSGIQSRLAEIRKAAAEHRRLLADPNYRAELEAIALLDQGKNEEAEPYLRQALASRPNDEGALGAMGLLRLRQGRYPDATIWFEKAARVTGANVQKWRTMIKVAAFWKLIREAREARNAGRFALAEERIGEASRLDPKEPNAVALLGDVQAEKGQVAEATATYRRALSIAPLNVQALEGMLAINRRQGLTQARRYAEQLTDAQRAVLTSAIARMELAAVEAKAEDPEDFLAALDMMPAEQRPDSVSRRWAESLRKRIESDTKAGRNDDARQLLREAETLAAGDEIAGLAVALAWGHLGDTARADRLFEILRTAKTPASVRWHLRHADYLAAINSPASNIELGAELKALAALPSLTLEEAEDLRDLQEAFAVRTARAQIDAKDPARARQTLAPYLKASPNRPRLLLAEADALAAEKQWKAAKAVYEKVIQLDPAETDALRGLIAARIELGERKEALAQLDEWTAGGLGGGAYEGSRIVDLYLALDQRVQAKEHIDNLLSMYPENGLILNQARRMAQIEGRPDDEIGYLQRWTAADRAEMTPEALAQAGIEAVPYQEIGYEVLGSPHKIRRDWKEKRIASLIDERSSWISAAVDVGTHPGTPGLSQSTFVEIPLEYRRPWHDNDQAFFRTDLIRLDVGTVAADSATFGQMLFCRPNCAGAPLKQHMQGKSITAGYVSPNLRADVGMTPQEFPVSNIVGGIRYSGDFMQIGYTLEASRRAVTSSLLSYAGTRDPMTGKVWGGVVETGGRLGLSVDSGGTFGFWSSLGTHSVTGRNVLSNTQVQALAGGQWRLVNEDNRLFSVGISGYYLRSAKNAGEYTFGHGGYYSPEMSRSISLPVSYGERYPRFSYLLNGSVSASQSRTHAAPYFPTDGTLQAAALAMPANAVYADTGTSATRGYSLEAVGEYQVTEQFFVGGMLSMTRSVNYTPNRMLFYLRYALDHGAAQPVFFRPRPVVPSSQF